MTWLRDDRPWGLAAAVAALIVAALTLALQAPAAAQEPIVGQVPASGVAFLVAANDTTAEELATNLGAQGCAATTIAVTSAGAWLIHVPGAPAFVNAAFPPAVLAGQPFAVLCAAPGAGSGVHGIALAGPQCPVEMAGVPCPDLPVDVDLAFRQGATTVATVQTGNDGKFSVPLPPGTYQVTTTGSLFPSLAPLEVTVPVDGYTWLELRLDTGIR